MKPERYTVMLVPDTAGTSRSFSLKRETFHWILAGLFVLLVALGIALYYYLPRALNYDALEAKNETLMEERFQVMRILDDYNRIRNMDRYIRQMLGAEIAPEKVQGTDDVPAGLDSLQRTRVNRAIPSLPHSAIDLLENVPSLPPVDGYVTQDFYNNAVFYDDNHYGLDIIARQGEVVKAAASGLVVFSNWTYQYGNTIILDHGNGYYSIYGHNQRNIIREREWVERGEPIAFLGNTGISRGPHLHFEVWKDGQPRNPKDFIFIYEDNDVSVERQKLD
ncbi:MAG: M23 family metallopeptidase [Candidatus Marinimicrobia bacterium]|nr:M23 family metallopeptidase [Candidatus Neomarinimicrobiota bacterium]MCF7829887.1 M23 family metallopeptidase [Candidatus Neomarinimicrobiota bacterium]MCF7879150.1 M23 family metallopeptidase [Candidatus Neomarinimicrobiota bacterium]